jgi:hypothetical protein
MKKFLLVIMMGLMVLPSLADGGKKKKKQEDNQKTEILSPVTPIQRERWIEKSGDNYVIVTRTTISKEDYHRIRTVNRPN